MKRPLILISNDDGYSAKGIHELVRMVAPLGDIIVCAPEGPRSGKSRAFTMDDITIRNVTDEFLHTINPQPSSDNSNQSNTIKKNFLSGGWEAFNQSNTIKRTPPRGDGGLSLSGGWGSLSVFACSGTPVDCIKIACGRLCPRRPDLILAGINHGDNASTNAHYSGTVGIAFEGAIKGIPSIAFSLCDYDLDADFTPMEETVTNICRAVLENGLPHFTFLNVNVPKVADASQLKGTRICRMAAAYWINEVEDSTLVENSHTPAENTHTPAENTHTPADSAHTPADSAHTPATDNADSYNALTHYQLKGSFHSLEPDAEDTDAWAIANNFVAVTPSTIDVTSHNTLDSIKHLLTQ